MQNARQFKMDYLFQWFLVEIRGNIAIAFSLGCAATLMFGRRRFFTLQGLFLGGAVGLTIDNANRNFKHLDGPGMKSM